MWLQGQGYSCFYCRLIIKKVYLFSCHPAFSFLYECEIPVILFFVFIFVVHATRAAKRGSSFKAWRKNAIGSISQGYIFNLDMFVSAVISERVTRGAGLWGVSWYIFYYVKLLLSYVIYNLCWRSGDVHLLDSFSCITPCWKFICSSFCCALHIGGQICSFIYVYVHMNILT